MVIGNTNHGLPPVDTGEGEQLRNHPVDIHSRTELSEQLTDDIRSTDDAEHFHSNCEGNDTDNPFSEMQKDQSVPPSRDQGPDVVYRTQESSGDDTDNPFSEMQNGQSVAPPRDQGPDVEYRMQESSGDDIQDAYMDNNTKLVWKKGFQKPRSIDGLPRDSEIQVCARFIS